MDKIINWCELSRTLAGNTTSISKNRCPQKYEQQVKNLKKHINTWAKENIN